MSLSKIGSKSGDNSDFLYNLLGSTLKSTNLLSFYVNIISVRCKILGLAILKDYLV